MQSSRRINDQNVCIFIFCGVTRVKHHGGRVTSLVLTNKIDLRALAPNGKLIDGSRGV